MIDYLGMVVGYLEGKMQPTEFERMLEENDELYLWMQSIVSAEAKICYCDPPSHELGYYPYNIRLFMKLHERLDYGGPKGSLSYHYYIHREILKLVKAAFPELRFTADMRPAILKDLELKACPGYIGGSEVAKSNILGKLLSDIPIEWSLSKQVKTARERIKAAFYIEGNHYPRWIQAPEWPISHGKPMKFLESVRINPEFLQHHFIDVDTGEVRIVNDFH